MIRVPLLGLYYQIQYVLLLLRAFLTLILTNTGTQLGRLNSQRTPVSHGK